LLAFDTECLGPFGPLLFAQLLEQGLYSLASFYPLIVQLLLLFAVQPGD